MAFLTSAAIARTVTALTKPWTSMVCVAEAVEAREDLRDIDKRETRILDSNPSGRADCSARSSAAADQARPGSTGDPCRVFSAARRGHTIIFHFHYFRLHERSGQQPAQGSRGAARIHSLILLTENPQELFPTIRSRAVIHRLGAVPADIEALLAQRRPRAEAARPALVRGLPRERSAEPSASIPVYLAARQDALDPVSDCPERAGLLTALSCDRNLSRRRRRPGEDSQPAPGTRQPYRGPVAGGRWHAGLIRNLDSKTSSESSPRDSQ